VGKEASLDEEDSIRSNGSTTVCPDTVGKSLSTESQKRKQVIQGRTVGVNDIS
jgi:hypothetical protein